NESITKSTFCTFSLFVMFIWKFYIKKLTQHANFVSILVNYQNMRKTLVNKRNRLHEWTWKLKKAQVRIERPALGQNYYGWMDGWINRNMLMPNFYYKFLGIDPANLHSVTGLTFFTDSN
ncbi:hypothetical protein L9F63_003892, partial [Diploptera punctata]